MIDNAFELVKRESSQLRDWLMAVAWPGCPCCEGKGIDYKIPGICCCVTNQNMGDPPPISGEAKS